MAYNQIHTVANKFLCLCLNVNILDRNLTDDVFRLHRDVYLRTNPVGGEGSDCMLSMSLFALAMSVLVKPVEVECGGPLFGSDTWKALIGAFMDDLMELQHL